MRNIATTIVFIFFIPVLFLADLCEAFDPAVYQVQKTLKELGYDPGQLDGIWGNKTREALREFQEDNSLPSTGQLDSFTKAKLKTKKPPKQLSLNEAVKQNQITIVKVLIDSGADIHVRDEVGETLLHVAAVRGFKEISAILIAEGTDVNARDERGLTPLHAAAWAGNEEIVAMLIQNGADVNARSIEDLTPLHTAAISGHKNTIEFLLSKGAAINARSKDGITPLHVAAFNGRREAVELMVARGADTGAENADGLTPRNVAAQAGHSEIVKLFRDLEPVEEPSE